MAYQDVTYQGLGGGIQTQYGSLLPPAGRVFYVHSSGGRSYDIDTIRGRTLSTLNSALSQCASGNGDTVYVLPGHTESIAAADVMNGLVAGTQIIGLGTGTNRPTFSFTAATSSFLIDVANVVITNCIFNACATATTTVTAAFPITAAGFTFIDNEVIMSAASDQKVTNLFTMSSAAHDFTLKSNYIRGVVDGASTAVVTSTGANQRMRILDNVITTGIATAATGILFDLSNAALVDNMILRNELSNTTSAARYAIKPHANSTGLVNGNTYYLDGSGALAPEDSGFTTHTTAYRFGRNWCVTTTGVGAAIETAPIQDT